MGKPYQALFMIGMLLHPWEEECVLPSLTSPAKTPSMCRVCQRERERDRDRERKVRGREIRKHRREIRER